MRFSLRSMLVAITLAAVGLAAWKLRPLWDGAVSCLLVGAMLVWAIGVRRLQKLEGPVATERWLRGHGKRK
jgi:hypothetical protein